MKKQETSSSPGGTQPKPGPPSNKGLKISKFFAYITPSEKILLILGTFGALIAGAIYPVIAILAGALITTFNPNHPTTQVVPDMEKLCYIIVIIGVGIWIFGYMYFAFWQHLAENISFDLRKRFLSKLLLQEIAYFEKQQVEALPSLIGEYFASISGAIGEKLSNIISTLATVVFGITVGLAESPVFGVINLGFIPVILLTLTCFGGAIKTVSFKKLDVSRQLGGMIEENLTAIKLIVSFAQEKKACDKYAELAAKCKVVTMKSEKLISTIAALIRFEAAVYTVYAYWIGAHFIQIGRINERTHEPQAVGDVISVQMAMMLGVLTFMALNPNIQALAKALAVGVRVFDVIDREPEIIDKEGSKDDFTLKTAIRFENITFKYPTAPEHVRNVLQQSSFNIKVGQSTAIVGPSGSGKSTIVQMIERFYNPLVGEIYFDDTNIKDITLKGLRESIGYVSQEPVLILGTIKDNILFGNVDATEAEIHEALRKANATFVFEMENGLETYIGSASVLNMSGGQKQRIAIARALVKKPKILILDEATSALDPRSEKEVQDAINSISVQDSHLTIIMIAHRLQTIETARNLVYLENNTTQICAEKGTDGYTYIIDKLQKENYAHQAQDEHDHLEEEHDDPEAIQKGGSKSQGPQEVDHPTTEDYNTERKNNDVGVVVHTEEVGLVPQSSQFSEIQLKQRKEQTQNEKLAGHKSRDVGVTDIMKFYSPKSLSVLAMFVTTVAGAYYPIMGYLTTKLLFWMYYPNDPDYSYWINFYCGMFLILGSTFGFSQFGQRYFFSILGENLTFTIRKQLFSAIIYKHVAWFDNKDKAPGVLSNILSEDISLLNGLSSETTAIIMETAMTLCLGFAIACYFSWRMALITMSLLPLVIAGAVISMKLTAKAKGLAAPTGTGNIGDKIDYYKESNALLSDVIMNYRTVISFGPKNVNYLMKKYNDLLLVPNRVGVQAAHSAGVGFGYAFFIRYIFLGIGFLICAVIIQKWGLDYEYNYIAVYVLFMSAIGAGTNASNMPSVSKAKASAKKIFEIIDEKSKVDVRDEKGEKVVAHGELEFRNVNFIYPSRTQRVLKNFNMTIPARKKIALVGYSGCGKSTIANLLLRFYDLNSGQLLIDGKEISEYNVADLRRQIGYVMQEPLLFNESIKENILYGNSNATDLEVWQAAQLANALQFIEQNIEDLDNENVQREIQETFTSKVSELSSKYQGFTVLQEKYDNKEFGIKELVMTLEVLNKCDQKLKILINRDTDRFAQEIIYGVATKGMKWEDIALKFEWSYERDSIVRFIYDNNFLTQEDKDDIELAFTKYATRFNFKIVKKFARSLETLDRTDNETRNHFVPFMLSEEYKVKVLKTARLKEMEDALTLQQKSQEFKLHEGFEKKCGLRGSMLSGGQKQRIAIARALIKNPKILILDEATSALDENSQEIVQQALDRSMEGRTSVVIAHRLSTIRNCEWLFVIHKGVVVEQGTYDDLAGNTQSYFYKLKGGMEM